MVNSSVSGLLPPIVIGFAERDFAEYPKRRSFMVRVSQYVRGVIFRRWLMLVLCLLWMLFR